MRTIGLPERAGAIAAGALSAVVEAGALRQGADAVEMIKAKVRGLEEGNRWCATSVMRRGIYLKTALMVGIGRL